MNHCSESLIRRLPIPIFSQWRRQGIGELIAPQAKQAYQFGLEMFVGELFDRLEPRRGEDDTSAVKATFGRAGGRRLRSPSGLRCCERSFGKFEPQKPFEKMRSAVMKGLPCAYCMNSKCILATSTVLRPLRPRR